MTRMACERCGDPCEAPEEEFEEALCEDCARMAALKSWRRLCRANDLPLLNVRRDR
jgi:hypothetical protein